ncbi:MAG: hypoxanthine phosphoribosyltransferase [Candidatus Zipacnadales bacterium]
MSQPEEYARNIARVILTEEALRDRVNELAGEISRDYAARELVLVGVLNGSVVFLADLLRSLQIPAEVEFVGMASYGNATVSLGQGKLTKNVDRPLVGKHVLVVEDIIDTAQTICEIIKHLQAKEPLSVEVCALLDKPSRRKVDFKPRYVGFTIPDEFVVGYGLDFAQHYRGLPYVAVLKPEAYEPPH